jgi:hypothetical protein
MIQMNALTPSAHHTGKAANRTTNGQVTGNRGRVTVLTSARGNGRGTLAWLPSASRLLTSPPR